MTDLPPPNIPSTNIPVMDLPTNAFTLPWRRFFQYVASLQAAGSVTPAEMAAVQALAEAAIFDALAAQDTATEALDLAESLQFSSLLVYLGLVKDEPRPSMDALALLGITDRDTPRSAIPMLSLLGLAAIDQAPPVASATTRQTVSSSPFALGFPPAPTWYVDVNNTSGVPVVLKLPASPAVGQVVVISDATGNAGTNAFTIETSAGGALTPAATVAVNYGWIAARWNGAAWLQGA